MKATITILAAVLTLHAGFLFADNKVTSTPVSNEITTITMAFLAPTTPVEATFEEIAAVGMNNLTPVTPAEATFEDVTGDMISTFDLMPAVPVQADFEDFAEDVLVDNISLAPATPKVADFE